MGRANIVVENVPIKPAIINPERVEITSEVMESVKPEKVIWEKIDDVPVESTAEKFNLPLPSVSPENVEELPDKVQTLIAISENVNVPETDVVPEKVNISVKEDKVDVPEMVQDLLESSYGTDEDEVKTHGSYFSHNNNNNIRPTVTQNVVYVTETQNVPQKVVYVEHKVPQQVVHVAQKQPEKVVYVEHNVPHVHVEQQVPQQVVYVPNYHDKCAICRTSECSQVQTCKNPNEVFKVSANSCLDKCDATWCQRVGITGSGTLRDGCYCKSGYKRSPYSVCIPESQCAQYTACGAYEQHTTNEDCSDHCQTNQSCVAGKVLSRCFCVIGYKKDLHGHCVLSTSCPSVPAVCPAYSTYSSGDDCWDSCNNKNCSAGHTVSRCFCLNGYKKNSNGICVLSSNCHSQPPQVCKGANEEYSNQNPCNERCDNSTTCHEVSKLGCYCKTGYLKNHLGVCVPESQCKVCQDPNEVYTSYGNSCLDTCYADVSACTALNKLRPLCYCKSGYGRNTSGHCVVCPPKAD